MKSWFSKVSVPTFVAFVVFTIIDRKFGIVNRIVGTIGL